MCVPHTWPIKFSNIKPHASFKVTCLCVIRIQNIWELTLHSVKKLSNFAASLRFVAHLTADRNFCIGLQKMHLFCNQVRIDHSRSSKVDDFGTIRKRVWYFLLVPHSNQGPIICDMQGRKLQIFPILLLCGARLRMFYMVLRAFVVKFTTKKLVMGLFSSENRVIVVWVILIQHQRVTDRQTDGRTDLL